MPYIKKEDRAEWDKIVKEISKKIENIPEDKKEGNLNYFITRLLKTVYIPGYFNYNRVMGLLECIKQEFYRRDIASYEDEKIQENGDVE